MSQIQCQNDCDCGNKAESLLFGCRAISKFLKVRREVVRRMHRMGAPIRKDAKSGVYACEKMQLWEWYKDHPKI